MNIKALFEKYDLKKVKINLKVAEAEIRLDKSDKNAAWQLYIELLTRIVTQPLPSEHGDEKTALDSVYSLFATTRETLRQHGPKAIHFSKVAIPVLNQVVRPFTSKWHKESLSGAFNEAGKREEFRGELAVLQGRLRNYNRMLAEIAGVEDLTELERTTPK